MAADEDLDVVVLAGHIAHDAPPEFDKPRLQVRLVRRILPLPSFMGLGSWSLFHALWGETKHADVVHVSLSRELIPVVAVIMARLRGRGIIVQPHGMLTSRTSRLHKLIDIFMRPLARGAQSVIALTQTEADQLSRWFGRKSPRIVSIGNPIQAPMEVIDAQASAPRADEALWIARLHPRKRAETYVDAARIACTYGWPERYVLVGPDEGDLQTVLDAENRVSNVVYEGFLPGREVPLRVARSKVFVLTADSEPWGNVLVTALALGVPVVLSATSALAQMVNSYGAGIVVPDLDSKGFARAVHHLLEDPDLYEVTAAGAHNMAREQLSEQVVANKLLDVYTNALVLTRKKRALR